MDILRRILEPMLVFHPGHFVQAELRRRCLSEEHLLASLRARRVVALRAATHRVVVCPDGLVSLLCALATPHVPRSSGLIEGRYERCEPARIGARPKHRKLCAFNEGSEEGRCAS